MSKTENNLVANGKILTLLLVLFLPALLVVFFVWPFMSRLDIGTNGLVLFMGCICYPILLLYVTKNAGVGFP